MLAATLHCIFSQLIKIIVHVPIKTGTDNNYLQQNSYMQEALFLICVL